MGKVAESMRQKLSAELDPLMLEITDQSESHRGHGGYREGGESHFHVHIVAAAFEGKRRVDRQRLVMKILADELAGPVHALAISAKAPSEA